MSGVVMPPLVATAGAVPLADAAVAAPLEAGVSSRLRLGSLRAATLGLVAIGLGGLLAIQTGVTALYAGRILPGVTVAGEQVGGLTSAEAQHKLTAVAAGRQVNLIIGQRSYHFQPVQLGINYDLATGVWQAYAAGRERLQSPLTTLSLLREQNLVASELSYRVDATREELVIQQLIAQQGQPAVDATIAITNGQPSIQRDRSGSAVTAEEVRQAINRQLAGPPTGPVTLEQQVLPAAIRTADLAPAVEQTQKLLAIPVTITAGAKSFTPSVAQKGAWITFHPNSPGQAPGLTPTLNLGAVMAYLHQAVASQVNVAAVPHRVNVLDGVASDIQAGQNGSAVDETALGNQIVAALGAGQAFSGAVPMVTVAFTTQYNQSVSLPFAKYVEVNLSTQHLWAYQDHQLVYDSPVTSGATGAGFPTVTGQFSILAKQTDRHLVGYQYGPRYNYDVFVQYWMPFYQGYGLHDASWRSSFGGQDYYYGGSHGCINLPLATAAWLYNWVDVGTPVWVHS